MKKQTTITTSDTTLLQEFKKARYLVMRDPDVKQYLRRNPSVEKELRTALWRSNNLACTNLKIIKDNGIEKYQQLVKKQFDSLNSTTEYYAKFHSKIPCSGEKPTLLCKYMPKGHAVENIQYSRTKYASVKEYRISDNKECRLPIDPETSKEEFMDIIGAKILGEVLKEKNLDLISIWNRIQEETENGLFVGCFTDGTYSDHMWKEYAKGDGACVWFRPEKG